MLQRAASNAYSWWWASHVRTKQSKWLEQSLQDMEEKVVETLRILEDQGDSFAKRAEMYYRKRPELVLFVEESFREYRALADRYDHLSRELQSANRTIASVFPEQVQYANIDEDDEESDPGTDSPSPGPNNQTQKSVIPNVPKMPKKDFRSPSMLLSRKGQLKRLASSAKYVPTSPSSGLSKAAALAEIDKLQKEILALQTEKEFVRSLYERSYEKYWEIEDQITGMQKRVYSLQDEFGVGTIIDDNDARALMAATALRSCQETLDKLKEIQAQSSKEAKVEYKRVKEAHEMFETLRDQFISKFVSPQDQGHDQDHGDKCECTGTKPKGMEEEMDGLEQEEHNVGVMQENIKEKLEKDSGKSLTVTEMAERIDALVNNVVTLETAVSSQTGLVKRLRSETDELQTNIRSLEEDKEMLIEGSEITNKKLEELEKELQKVKLLNRSVRSHDNSLQTHFTEASCNLEHLSGRLNNMKPDVEDENLVLYKKKGRAADENPGKESDKHGDELSGDKLAGIKDVKTTKEEKQDDAENLDDVRNEVNKSNLRENMNLLPERIQRLIQHDKDDFSDTTSNLDIESQDLEIGDEDQPKWRQMFISGLDDREKILLEEYTSVLRSYKDVRVKLNDVEKKNRDSIFEMALQLRDLRDAVATKDREINVLHQKLHSSETNPGESPYTTTTEYKYTPQEALNRKAGDQGGTNLQQDSEIPSSNSEDVENTANTSPSPGNTSLEKLMASTSDDKGHHHDDLSNLEKRFRSDIDNLLEENLEFWLRFSTSVHQIQKFQNSIQDLKSELWKIKENDNKSEGSSSTRHQRQSTQSQIRPIFKHLREIRTELSLWLEHNAVLRDELQGRFSSLCNVQDEIIRAGNAEERGELSGYQAAKFQGEVVNMKQENKKVASELQAGLSLVKGMKNEVEKTLDELDQRIGVNSSGTVSQQSTNRVRIPLRSFLFGVKLKRQKHPSSLFACVNPAMQKQYRDLTGGNNAPL